MLRQRISARIALPAISAVALLLAGCGTTISGNPQAAPGGPQPTSTGKPSAAPTGGGKPSAKPSAKPSNPNGGGKTDFKANIGDCVKLGGTTDNAIISKETCGGKEANYKVVAKAKTNAQCPADIDQAYYETTNGVETGAICLDIDWVIGDCLDLGGEDPHRVSCTGANATEGVKVLSILKNTSSIDDCTSGDKGYAYETRQVVVCLAAL
ncbi:hypothetical protein LTV02_31715 [Nocardia yamanashiensis]|uniref:LppU family putative lipoprotein n=1 Tax=Nocardia yamanashiensis TaxID=209247 RepID=UPI001E629CE3|nr:hypothetical protein [Nocardia yamanashiensis]UGT40527.1 hypothetical protein LTV02_31715 [Nocardia yamanashiensis]